MTTEEVEIQTTETEEVHICDGCGIETDDSLEYKPFTTSGYHNLHFCDTGCVDSVRATDVRESEEVGSISSAKDYIRDWWDGIDAYGKEFVVVASVMMALMTAFLIVSVAIGALVT